MKRFFPILALLALTLTLLSGCAMTSADSGSSAEGYTPPDLNAFFDKMQTKFQWDEGYFMDLDEATFAATYPGLEEFEFAQKVAKMPMMTSVVNEFVLLECEDVDDTGAVAQILKERVLLQAEGGAWYPESMAAWEEAHVLITDQYVALIASGEKQNGFEMAWNQQFGK